MVEDIRAARRGAGLLAALGLAVPLVVVPTALLPAAAANPALAATGTTYRYVRIAPLGANVFGRYNTAEAVNTAGTVVGSSSVVDGSHAYTWRAGVAEDLGVLNTGTGPRESEGAGLNDRGVVVGATQVDGPGNTGQHAFVHRDGRSTDLGTGYAAVQSGSAALAVNDAGVVVGIHYADQSKAFRAVVWQDGRLRELPGLGGTADDYGVITQPNAINDAGQIVGTAQPRSSTEALHGVLWENGRVRDLGNLGGTSNDTQANDINDAGVVVGRSWNGRQLHAFSWEDGVMRDLGGLTPNYPNRISEAYAINNSGTVVGDTRVGDGTSEGLVTATLWRGGKALDLNDLVVGLPAGVHLQVARDVSDAGVIVGESCTLASHCHGGRTAYALIPLG